MKTIGIVLVVFAVLDFVVFCMAVSAGENEYGVRMLGAACMMGALGGYLIAVANKKKRKEEDKRNWEDGE